MKVLGFLVAGIGLMCLSFSCSNKGSTSSSSEMIFPLHGDDIQIATSSRKLKETGYTRKVDKGEAGNEELEDYHPIDPVPSSKASVRPGPIQHGTPLMPYIPKPSPPGHPKQGGYPSPTSEPVP